jgi:DNA-directed RNA polymerase subunit H (RpoH/RPB5)
MLTDRGYSNVQSCQSVEEVIQNMEENRFVVSGNGPKCVHVFFHNEDRVGVKQLRNWIESSMADAIIVVSLDGPTAFTRKEAEQNYQQVQFFTFKEMCVNITKHAMVPKHEKMDPSKLPFDVSESKNELPILYTTDKIAQYYAYDVGDVVRITRTVGCQEPLFFYRVVTPPPSA